MHFFPHFHLHLNSIALFGITLLLGLIGGEIAGRTRFLPRILGYIAIGFLAGPGGFNFVDQSVLTNARIFVDISLSLILFDLGRHLDFVWLRHDRGLLPMALTESLLTLLCTFVVLHFLIALPKMLSLLAGVIAMTTSPAVVMMVAHDLSSEGPVTRRTLILTSLNNLFGLLLFTLLLPLTQTVNFPGFILFIPAVYRLCGSLILGLSIFVLLKLIAHFIGKQKDNQFILFVGAVTLTLGLARVLDLSSMLTLFILGVAARNFDSNHALMEVDFGWLARLFFILLFVVTGVQLQLQGLRYAPLAVILFILARLFSKTSGVLLFAKASRLTRQQAYALSLTLCPMAGVAMGMSYLVVDFNSDFGQQILHIMTGAIALLTLIGPILTQFAFVKTGEALAIDGDEGALR